MSITIKAPKREDLRPRIIVFGVGGAGCNAINNMIAGGLEDVSFYVANTDAQVLKRSSCENRVQLGLNKTHGLGAGCKPDVGREAAEEAIEEIKEILEGCDMIFITAGMGGGTGTGAAPVIACAADKAGVLTVGVVTRPFAFEGSLRQRLADQGIKQMEEHVDTLIVIPNQNLFEVADEHTTFEEAFKMADRVLESGVRGITDLIVNPGLINLDFADIRSVMQEMGRAMLGVGESDGEDRAEAASKAAISNPLLENLSISGARCVLINITGSDLTLHEIDKAVRYISKNAEEEANITVGSAIDPELHGIMRVSVVATGIENAPCEKEESPFPSTVHPFPVRKRQVISSKPAVEVTSVSSNAAEVLPKVVEKAAPEAEEEVLPKAAEKQAASSMTVSEESRRSAADAPTDKPEIIPTTQKKAPKPKKTSSSMRTFFGLRNRSEEVAEQKSSPIPFFDLKNRAARRRLPIELLRESPDSQKEESSSRSTDKKDSKDSLASESKQEDEDLLIPSYLRRARK